MAHVEVRERPVLHEECCKGCGRCREACARDCIALGADIHALSGLTPIVLHLEACNGCGLCVEACPEPYGLEMSGATPGGAARPEPPRATGPAPVDLPDTLVPLPAGRPLVMKGTHASAIGALLAGCRHFFGYPITPSTEGAELMAKLLPAIGGSFLQAPSEVAAVNMMYGAGAAGQRAMTFTSSPGFSLMLEGVSYMIGARGPRRVRERDARPGPGSGTSGRSSRT